MNERMSVIIQATVKDKGTITWPPIGEPDLPAEGSIEARAQRREWLRDRIRDAAEDTRVALGTGDMTRVAIRITFRPDIMVDPA